MKALAGESGTTRGVHEGACLPIAFPAGLALGIPVRQAGQRPYPRGIQVLPSEASKGCKAN